MRPRPAAGPKSAPHASLGGMSRYAALAALAATLAGCQTGRNYARLDGPRYGAGPSDTLRREPANTHRLTLVSFNIAYARRVESAIAVLAADPALRSADVILLQEMDDAGTRRVAQAFGMAYVYYPGTFSLKTRRDFGNAVLSRWPIVGDSKILLPHLGVLGRLQRTATAATILVGGTPVRVYSTHLGTPLNATPAAQRAQLRAVLADAEGYPRVVIGGDMNSHHVGGLARERGYAWPTEHGPRTTRFGRWDHIFLKGVTPPSEGGGGHRARRARCQRPPAGLGARHRAIGPGRHCLHAWRRTAASSCSRPIASRPAGPSSTSTAGWRTGGRSSSATAAWSRTSTSRRRTPSARARAGRASARRPRTGSTLDRPARRPRRGRRRPPTRRRCATA